MQRFDEQQRRYRARRAGRPATRPHGGGAVRARCRQSDRKLRSGEVL